MSLLHDGAFLAHLSQSKVEAKQQMSIMIDAIYDKVMLDLELWLNNHDRTGVHDSSVRQLEVNHNDATNEPMELMLPNTQMSIQQNANSPPSLPPSHLQSHSNHFTVKSEIESDCEENLTEQNLPGESPDWQSTQPESIQPTHSITHHSPPIVKEEIVDDDDVEVDSQVIQNEQSANARGYFPHDIEIDGDFVLNFENNGISKCSENEGSNRLSPNALSQQPLEYNQERMHSDDDLDFDKETLDEVKREIEKDENMKRRENELEAGDIRPNEDGDRMESNAVFNTQSTIEHNDHGQLVSNESKMIQQNQNDANNAIEDHIANESTTNSTQSTLLQPIRHLQCPHCPKLFVHRCRLQEHLRVHTGERPFQCDQCGKCFRKMNGLTQHLLIHQNIRRFRCEQCDKRFTQKCNLVSHLRTHSGARPYKCRFCEQCFTEISTRRKHEQAKHLHVMLKVLAMTSTSSTNDKNVLTSKK